MQLRSFLLHFRVLLMKRPEVLQGIRMLFNRNKMETPAARGIAAPRLPGGEEVEAEAEAGLEDDEALAPAPPGRELISIQENEASLFQPSGGAVVDVAERLRVGNAVPEFRAGGNERRWHPAILGPSSRAGACRPARGRRGSARRTARPGRAPRTRCRSGCSRWSRSRTAGARRS